MNTLATPPVKALLDRLFSDAQRTMAKFRETREELVARGLGHDSPELAEAVRHAHLAVAPATGQLLYLLVRARRPQTIVEFGASFGVSAVHLAAALRDNGSGLLVTTEAEPTKAAACRATLSEAGLADLVEVREGDALETLATGLPGPIDFLFLDGAKHLYLDLLAMLGPDLADAALVVADNADTPGYRDYVRSQAGWVSVEIDKRVEVTLLTGPPS